MTKHSTLTNPNDLHYSKIRTFTGDPTGITPDFIDQILTATDTNKVYRATGITIGGLVELSTTEEPPEGGSSSMAWEFLEWGDYQGTIQLESNKKYIKKKSGDILALFPVNPVAGNCLLFTNVSTDGFLYLDSQGVVIRIDSGSASTSPFDLYGDPQYRQYMYIDQEICELIFVGGNEWRVVSGRISYRQHTPPILGCTDSLARNYNPLATVDDDSCEYDD